MHRARMRGPFVGANAVVVVVSCDRSFALIPFDLPFPACCSPADTTCIQQTIDQCAVSDVYYGLLSVCLPRSSDPILPAITALERLCPGANVTTSSQLAQMRFCTRIDGPLQVEIHENVTDAEYAAFERLGEIKGSYLSRQYLLSRHHLY